MKLAAFSDTHGCLKYTDDLPVIEQGTDVIVIAGDIIPLGYQRSHEDSMVWFRDYFLPWAKYQQVMAVIFIGGNHDKYFEQYRKEVLDLIEEAGLSNKVFYLLDEGVEIGGKHFFGTPWIENLKNWSFYTADPYTAFAVIPDECDVLISHTPPRVETVGCSYPGKPYERNFGSQALKDELDYRNIPVIICGHIHTGTHGGVKYGYDKIIYNVSMIDEDYREAYPVTYIEI